MAQIPGPLTCTVQDSARKQVSRTLSVATALRKSIGHVGKRVGYRAPAQKSSFLPKWSQGSLKDAQGDNAKCTAMQKERHLLEYK